MITKKAFLYLYGYLKKYSCLILFNFFLIPFISFTHLVQPYVLKLCVDDFLSGSNRYHFNMICIFFIVMVLLEFFLRAIQSYLFQYVGQKIVFLMRADLFSHIQSLALTSFYLRPFGELISCLTSDMLCLDEFLTSGSITILSDFLVIISIIIIMFCMNFSLAFLVLIIFPFLIIVLNIIGHQLKKIVNKMRTITTIFSATLKEELEGLAMIQSFKKKDWCVKAFDNVNQSYKKMSFFLCTYDTVFYSFVEVFVFVVIAIILFYVFFKHHRNTRDISIGVIVAFIDYTYKLFTPFKDISKKIVIVNRAFVSLEKIAKVFQEKGSFLSGKKVIEDPEGYFLIKNLSFSYPNYEKKSVLNDLSFEIKKGQMVALVGPSGSGKSTIMKILSGLYKEYQGSILFDHMELKELSLKNFQSHVCVLFQQAFLLPGSIEFNVRMGDSRISKKEMRDALCSVGMEKRIHELPQSYDTCWNPQNNIFSQGESQLIAFARCLVSCSPIVFLDEPTASIDSLIEEKIVNALESIRQKKTIFVIAQRLSTIKSADNIIYLEGGKIMERGSHKQLMHQRGRYEELFQLNFS